MKNKSESARTSAGQLKWIGSIFCSFFCGLARHVQKFGLFYGFVSGSFVTLCVLAALIWYVFLDFPLPWKITDPSDPRFDPMKFEFTDYVGDDELQRVLDIMFSIGTEKSEVENFLMKIGKAKGIKYQGPDKFIEQSDERYYYTYRHLRGVIFEIIFMVPENEFTWKISVVYDHNNKLKKLHVI